MIVYLFVANYELSIFILSVLLYRTLISKTKYLLTKMTPTETQPKLFGGSVFSAEPQNA